MSYRRRHSFRPMLDQLEKRDFPGLSWEGLGCLLLGSELAFLLGNPTEASTAGAAAASTSESLQSSWLVPAGSPVGDFGFLNAFASNRSNTSESPPINSFNSQTLNSDELDYVFAFDQDQFDDLLDMDFDVFASSAASTRAPALGSVASGSQEGGPAGRFALPDAVSSARNNPAPRSPAQIQPLELSAASSTASGTASFSESLSDTSCSGGVNAGITATDADAAEIAVPPPDTGQIVIDCTLDASSVAYTVSGTAIENEDYILTKEVGVLSNNSVTLTVTPIPDSELEGSETVIITLTSHPVGDTTRSATVTIGEPMVTLGAGHISHAGNVVPGAPVMLNDDNDDNNEYPDPSPAGHRPFEPVFDLDQQTNTTGENDLMALSVDVSPNTLPGNAELSITPGGDQIIRLWATSTKANGATDLLTLPRNYAASANPQTIYVEGIKIGTAALMLTYTTAGVSYRDELVVNVVSLVNKSVINPYATPVDFEVVGGKAGYDYLWDVDGDGNTNDLPEALLNGPAVSMQYGPEDGDTPISVGLPRDAAHKRQTYNVNVQLTDNFKLYRPIRVALDAYYGTLVTTGNQAARRTEVLGLGPVAGSFNLTEGAGEASQTWFEDNYDADPLTAVNDNRLLYGVPAPATRVPRIANAATIANATPGAGRRVYVIFVLPGSFESLPRQTLDDLRATIAHEQKHVDQHAMVRTDDPADNVWRLLDNYFTAQGMGVRGYLPFRETEGHLVELRDANVGWFHQIAPNQNDLPQFVRYYLLSLDLYEVIFEPMPANTPVRAASRGFLQKIYRDIPFAEMKKEGNDFFVRPPE